MRLFSRVKTGSLPEAEWRRAVLLSLPMAGVAFLLGALLDGPSGQSTPFDRLSYPLLTAGVVLLELLLWKIPAATNKLITAVVISMSAFFLSKLIYILNFMPSGFSVQAEMTESFFWIPALYVLSFFVPNLRLARIASAAFFGSVLLFSLIYIITHSFSGLHLGVGFALLELNLANLTLLSLTNTFIGFKERFSRGEAQSETLQQLAYSDLLTGLPNRLQLDRALRQAERQGAPFSLLFIDMDGFKLINDTLGHAAGDEVLREISGRFGPFLRPGDLAARLSGDEFVIMMHEVEPGAAVEAAGRIHAALIHPYQAQGQICHLPASIGVSSFPHDAQDALTLLKHADSAMYSVKSGSKNAVRRFEPLVDAEVERRKTLDRELQFALARQQFHLVYQPIYALGSGKLCKVEALLRWTHPVFGVVSPSVFIPLAEANSEIIALGKWALRAACLQARQWLDASADELVLTVNVSPLQFAQPDFVESVREALQQSGLTPAHLLLELTEGAVMKSLDAVQRT
ncbi:MAG: putative bifunctional diguanylate cyclase/phosphodiesterase, partial [Deinococcus sp.]